MNQASRNQGWAICVGAAVAALLFVVGVLNGSYWALAIPVAIVTLFALGLIAWVGYTIATIQVDADVAPEILSTDSSANELPTESVVDSSDGPTSTAVDPQRGAANRPSEDASAHTSQRLSDGASEHTSDGVA